MLLRPLALALLGSLVLLAARLEAKPPLLRTPAGARREVLPTGTHWRINAPEGVLHVFRPEGYRHARAGVVLFVHGYHLSADRAWTVARLAEQFSASRQNALFIVVDGPSGPTEPVRFPALSQVLRIVGRHVPLPRGQIVAVGHSGAYRTLVSWLDHRFLGHVVLLDALYAEEERFHDWIATHRDRGWHRLTVVARDTQAAAQRLARRLGRSVRQGVPERYEELSRRDRAGAVAFISSQYGHAEMFTNGKVLPLVLRLTRLRVIR